MLIASSGGCDAAKHSALEAAYAMRLKVGDEGVPKGMAQQLFG
jgi:hypothetical protein